MKILHLGAALAALALLAAAPAVAAQTSTTFDKPTPGDAAAVAAGGSQRSPFMARGDSTTLMVWADERTEVGSLLEQSGVDVHAQLLDADGQPTSGPFVITDAFGTQTSPRAVWNGTHWLVAWVSQVPSQFFYEWTVQAVRVAPDGTIVDAVPVTIPFADSSSVGFDLALLGSSWAFVFQGTSSGNGGINAVRIGADGTLLDTNPVQLVPPTFFLYFGIEANGTNDRLLLTYTAQSNNIARMYDTDLNLVSGPTSVPGTRTASNGTDFYLVWTSGQNLVGSPIDANASPTVPGGVVLSPVTSISGYPYNGSIGWDGTLWWIGWDHAVQGIQARRVRDNGQTLGGILTLNASDEPLHSLPSLVTLPNGGVQFVWQDLGGSEWNVWGQRLFANGTTGPLTPMVEGARIQVRTELAAGPNGTFVLTALSSDADGDRALLWPLDRFGNATSDPVVIATGTTLGAPAAAWNGQEWLVAWTDSGQVQARRYDAGLAAIDTVPISVMPGFSADVEALGDDFLVVGTEFGSSIQFLFPYGVRVDGPTGAVLDPTPILLGNSFAQLPRVIEHAGRWLVTWQRNYSQDDPLSAIEYCFVDSSGANTTPQVATAGGGRPDVASDGSHALVAWRTGTLASADTDIRALLIDAAGAPVSGTVVVTTAARKQRDPAVGFDGNDFVVVWEDLRDAAAFFDERTALYGARVSTAGTVLDPSGFAVAAGGTPILDPALVRTEDEVIVAAARFADEPDLAYRAITRRIGHWADTGEALAGPSGSPRLDALGDRAAGSSVAFQVSQAPGSTFGWYVLGATRVDTPVASGLLTPSPDLLVAMTTGPLGRALVNHTFAASTVTPGSSLYMQAWLVDLTAPDFVVATQAIEHTAP